MRKSVLSEFATCLWWTWAQFQSLIFISFHFRYRNQILYQKLVKGLQLQQNHRTIYFHSSKRNSRGTRLPCFVSIFLMIVLCLRFLCDSLLNVIMIDRILDNRCFNHDSVLLDVPQPHNTLCYDFALGWFGVCMNSIFSSFFLSTPFSAGIQFIDTQ